MKILIVSNSFYPQNSPRAFRTTELAKEFSNLGHQVTVYAPLSDHDYTGFLSSHPNIILKEGVKLNEKIINILGGKFAYLIDKILEIFMHYPYIQLLQKLPNLLKEEQNHDLLISIAFPHPIHWGVARAIKKYPSLATKWVADCGDPFMKNDGKGFRKKMFYFKYFEKNWCRKCDFITVPYEQQRSKYYPEFSNKIRIIPQGFDIKNIKIAEYHKNKVPTFIFAGTFYLTHRNPTLLLEFLSKLNFDFRFIIYTNRQDILLPYKPILGEKLVVNDYIKRENLINEMSKADFLVNIENGNEINERPSKLIDYQLANRPVLSVNSFKLEIEKIQSFLSGDYSGQMEKVDIKQFDIRNVAQQFLSLK